ncbi:MAG TPA: hypothetical protein VGR03_12635 [Candidatus Acidoferrum sp.]|nr:hypothetical protein [Candidatus Acidoferrum sp.]
MKRLCLAVSCFLMIATMGVSARGDEKRTAVVLFPRLSKGQVLRYQISYHRMSRTSTTSMVQDPVSAVNSELSLGLGIRIEVVEITEPGAASADARPAIRLRAAYERAVAMQRTDDPVAEDSAAEKRFAQLEGKSFDCTLDGNGVQECKGTGGDLLPGAAEGMRGWLAQVFAATSLPQKGIAPGESWGDEQEAGEEIPLAGLHWVRQFTFVREEPCLEVPIVLNGEEQRVPLGEEVCAEIRVRNLLVRRGHAKDATPESFRVKGLRTAGSARGANESMIRISMTSGLTVTAGDTGWLTADFTVSTADRERKIRTASELKTDSNLTRVRDLP